MAVEDANSNSLMLSLLLMVLTLNRVLTSFLFVSRFGLTFLQRTCDKNRIREGRIIQVGVSDLRHLLLLCLKVDIQVILNWVRLTSSWIGWTLGRRKATKPLERRSRWYSNHHCQHHDQRQHHHHCQHHDNKQHQQKPPELRSQCSSGFLSVSETLPSCIPE